MAKKMKDSKKSLVLGKTKKKKGSQKGLVPLQMQRLGQLPTTWFDDVSGQKFLPTWFSGETGLWTPAIHVLEKEDKFVAKFELPGVNEEDIGISIMGDRLIVQGEKKAESELKKKGYFYRETSYGSFSRSITIPSIVDTDWISANFDKGILEIDLPKIPEIQPKKISVTANKRAKAIGNEIEKASSSLEIDVPKTAKTQSKKVNAAANKKTKTVGKDTETASNANGKTVKSEEKNKA